MYFPLRSLSGAQMEEKQPYIAIWGLGDDSYGKKSY